MNPYISALAKVSTFSEEIIEELNKYIHFDCFHKGKELLKIGQVAKYIYFIKKGVARVYYLKEEKDVTDYFAIDNQFIGAVASLFTKEPSKKAIEILEDSEVYYMSYDDFELLCQKFHEVEKAGRKLAIYGILEGQQRIESIRFLSASERYHELEQKYPGISNRIPLKYIASYLGTTQVSLSRIRGGIQ